jgi:transposase
MLREWNVVEQRYQAVLQVLDGIPVTEVAGRFGVVRQTVHPVGGALPGRRY